MKIFNLESPFMQFLGKMADLMWLNLLTFICCIPIITIGPAVTALHYVCLKIVRDEELYITKSYFKSFKQNFKQSLIIWLIFLAVGLVMAYDFYLLYFTESPVLESMHGITTFMSIVLLIITVMYALIIVIVFPLQAKFDNPIKVTIKNALLVAIMQLPRTVAMIVISFGPMVLLYFVAQSTPFVLIFGISVPAVLNACLYNKTFKRIEGDYEEKVGKVDLSAEDEHIFSDEFDPEISGETDEK